MQNRSPLASTAGFWATAALGTAASVAMLAYITTVARGVADPSRARLYGSVLLIVFDLIAYSLTRQRVQSLPGGRGLFAFGLLTLVFPLFVLPVFVLSLF